MIHRGDQLRRTIKYWILPDIENRVANGEVKAYFQTIVTEIKQSTIRIRNLVTGVESELPNDFVFALTGYHTDNNFLRSMGVSIDAETMKPSFNPETMRSNVRGIYLAGVVTAGKDGKDFHRERAVSWRADHRRHARRFQHSKEDSRTTLP